MKDIDRVFAEISNTKQLENIPIFLIFNKCDLLNVKLLKKKNFKKFYQDFQGNEEFEEVYNYFEEKLSNSSKFYSNERIFVLPSIGVVEKIAQKTLQATTKIYSLFEAKNENIKEIYQKERNELMEIVKEEIKK